MTARLITCHSIIQLDARHPYASRALLDAQAMHRNVMSGFRGWVEDGAPDARAQMGVLSTWSIDLKTDTLIVVVQSRITPDWSTIPHAALRVPVEVKAVDRPINLGDTYTVRAVVSASNTRRDLTQEHEVKLKRMPHIRPDHVRTWIQERLQPAGTPAAGRAGITRIGADADPSTLAIRMLPPLTASTHNGLKVVRSEIRATLTVTDPHTFVTTLNQGIGRARAYSCGLLLTRPTNT